jgi:hypothetical protein
MLFSPVKEFVNQAIDAVACAVGNAICDLADDRIQYAAFKKTFVFVFLFPIMRPATKKSVG